MNSRLPAFRPPVSAATWLAALVALACTGAPAEAAAAASPTAAASPGTSAAPPSPAPAGATVPATPAIPAIPDVAQASRRAWWMAFDDAALNLLVQIARQRESAFAALRETGDAGADGVGAVPIERDVTAAYLGVRVTGVRWTALDGLREAAQRQRQLLGDAADAAGAGARDTLDRRLAQVAAQQAQHAAQRDALLARLAERCGYATPQLVELLAPVLGQQTLPAFASAVPARLPRSILRERPDVAAAEAALLRSAVTAGPGRHDQLAALQRDAARATDGWIDPAAPPASPAPADGNPDPAAEAWRTVLDEAAAEVSADLRRLADESRRQADAANRAETSRLAFLAARDRVKTGEMSELQALELYQQLLADADTHAARSGELALAWMQLVASTGASERVLVRR